MLARAIMRPAKTVSKEDTLEQVIKVMQEEKVTGNCTKPIVAMPTVQARMA